MNFRHREVNCKAAYGLDGLAATIGVGEKQFVIVAPTMDEIRFAWERLREADPLFGPLNEHQVQAVCIVGQHAAPGDELP